LRFWTKLEEITSVKLANHVCALKRVMSQPLLKIKVNITRLSNYNSFFVCQQYHKARPTPALQYREAIEIKWHLFCHCRDLDPLLVIRPWDYAACPLSTLNNMVASSDAAPSVATSSDALPPLIATKGTTKVRSRRRSSGLGGEIRAGDTGPAFATVDVPLPSPNTLKVRLKHQYPSFEGLTNCYRPKMNPNIRSSLQGSARPGLYFNNTRDMRLNIRGWHLLWC